MCSAVSQSSLSCEFPSPSTVSSRSPGNNFAAMSKILFNTFFDLINPLLVAWFLSLSLISLCWFRTFRIPSYKVVVILILFRYCCVKCCKEPELKTAFCDPSARTLLCQSTGCDSGVVISGGDLLGFVVLQETEKWIDVHSSETRTIWDG